ncbi:MATE family efflux transporter [Sphingopyxis flava]|uniref:Putative efflux protein, MATE family n=1 Tax=Sphingopyxis flava TaxID=1507287 RepID=A0A1T5BBU8_9SPHN|nr:MATE family efflux transporter [Sphingopyxis flava]SKB44605.1 putative efflux protein, MATE family [Sphingopyxis flava]
MSAGEPAPPVAAAADPPAGPVPPRQTARGSTGMDLTGGPITRTLIIFALPTLASNILQTLSSSVNSIWVGQFLGESALAATANANIIMFLMFATFFGFGMAATVLIGQAIGRGDIAAARRASGGAIGLALLFSLVIALVGWFASDAILHLLETPPEAFALAHDYLRVTFIAIPATMLMVTLMMASRGAGDAVTPLRFMILSVVLDIILNPVLILGLGPFPRLGIAGSALATAVAGTISLAAMLGWFYARDHVLRLRGHELSYLLPDAKELRFIIGRGLPMGAQMLVISGAGLVMVGLVNREGLVTAAAYGATLQLWNYVQMPALAVGAAVSAMAAQNIGAHRWDRVGSITNSGIAINLVMTGALILLLLAFDRAALGLFLGRGSEAVEVARHIQLVATWTFLPFGTTIVIIGTLRANGSVIPPLIIVALSMFPIRLGIYALGYPALGGDAIWWSFPLSSLAALAMAWAVYRRGNWRRTLPGPQPAP